MPTGIPLLSTVTGVPMMLLVVQYFARPTTPWLPEFVGRRGLPRGKLQDFLGRMRPRHRADREPPSIPATTGG